MMSPMDVDNVNVDTKVRTFLKEVYQSFDGDSPTLIHSALDSVVILTRSSSDKENKFRDNTRHPSSSEGGWALVFQHFPTTVDQRLARESFLNNHYSRFADLLLGKLTLDWVDKLNKNKLQISLLSIFLHANHAESFLTLLRRITTSSLGYQVNKCVSLLEQFLNEHRLVDIIWAECVVDKKKREESFYQELIRAIVSLPSRTANKLKDQNSLLFYPAAYTSLLSQDLLKVFHKVHDSLKNCTDCSLQFVSQLFSSICYSGSADALWNEILPEILKNVKADFIWRRICKRFVVGGPDQRIESVIIPLLAKLPWYGLVEVFIGDAVLEIPKVKYLLCTKVLLHRFFEKNLLLQNTLGYLASSPGRRPVFIQVFKTLVNVWGDSSALRHTSYEQHHYISRAILICAGFISEKDREEDKQAAASSIMYGMQNHLENIDPNIHILGMAVTELMVAKLNPNGPELQFTYEKTQAVKDLQKLIDPPQEPSESLSIDVPKPSSVNQEAEKGDEDVNEINPQSKDYELDSDDDEFEPYDMSNDKELSKVKTPKYLRDCMEGLINTEDVDRVEVCLTVAEDLIRSSPHGLEEVAVEFSRILLHLTNISSCTGLIESRFRALVAITVLCPIEATTYLTEQIYARNYNIRQRLDILEVLGAAAMELAKPNPQKCKSGNDTVSQTDVKIQLIQPEKKVYNWQEIVQKRIDSKTRRFAKGRTEPEPQAVPNKFSSVAGYFFYPLLKNYDTKDASVDIVGEDPAILERLLYTLGIVLYSATNTMAVKQMGQSLFDFIWGLRYHPESSVCQALIFGVSMIYLSVPSHILLGEMQQDTMEFKEWLQDIIEKNPHAESQKLAAQTLMILQNVVQKEFS